MWKIIEPAIIYETFETLAYEDYFGTPQDDDSAETTDHYTERVTTWENIMNLNIIVWGPMLSLGMLALSDVLPASASFYIQHGLSNLMIPAHIYGAYMLYELAISEGTWIDWSLLPYYALSSLAITAAQMRYGSDAMYFLLESPHHADRQLYPSLFYLLNWIEHTPRQ